MPLLKLLRLILAGLLVLAWLASLFDGLFAFVSTGVLVGVGLALLWLVPLAIVRQRELNAEKTPAFREGFEPDIWHDNIALDPHSDVLWIRDASGAERYLERSDLLSWKSNHDWNNGTFRQRIEIDVKDVARPRWHVLFQRHSDTWKKTSQRNGQERDEWFARLRAWQQQPSSAAAQLKAAGIDTSLPGLHSQYYQSRTEQDHHNWLVAFDIGCLTAGLDQKTEWERLGGTYPGPSEDLLKFKRT